MATPFSSALRRSALGQASAKLTAPLGPAISRRSPCSSAATKTITSLSARTRPCPLVTGLNVQTQKYQQSYDRRQSLRWKSNDSSTDNSLRQWGFEEINASLPADSPTSPTHAPIILIDVREPAELTGTGIIPSAVAIPLASQPDALFLTPDEFETRFGFPKPGSEQDGEMVFYCKAGVRARAAAQLAVQAGYDPARIGVYEGSWLDWEKRGGKVEKWEGEDL
ncbi:hypothetical protein N7474_009312 [Penicillium riverlandense]|uniref:uncharacterized protein n=1 Tax=Penicillium riverlandense TaxID=1903569 RepID=UPI00254986C3|nr:uncharacterized protein N7474_009312 [Penicillium riverlandense]KAJ5808043.1 hypothetical protein N7474_009312 [Penicillium riverlandense]